MRLHSDCVRDSETQVWWRPGPQARSACVRRPSLPCSLPMPGCQCSRGCRDRTQARRPGTSNPIPGPVAQARQGLGRETRRRDAAEPFYASGFSWRDIARLLEVECFRPSRSGETVVYVTTKNVTGLRDFMAGYDMVAAHKIGVDIASWLDIPIMSDVPITPIGSLVDSPILCCSLSTRSARTASRPEATLDEYDPDWRRKYRDDGFETFAGLRRAPWPSG